MDSLKTYIKNNYSVIIAAILFILLELPFLDTSRPILIDEAFYSNPSKNFVEQFNFHNTSIGFGGNGSISYSLYLSLYFFLFGAGLFTARISSMLLGIVSLFLFKKMFELLKISKFGSLTALLFFISTNLYLSIFKFARPEALTFTLCMILLLTLYYYVNNEMKAKYLAVMLPLTFAITNSHPFGSLIIVLSGLVITYLIFKRKEYKKLYHPALIAAVYVISLLFVIYFFAASNSMPFSESLDFVKGRSALTSFFSELIQKIIVTRDYHINSARIVSFLPHIILIIAGLFFYRKDRNIFIASFLGIATLLIAYLTMSSSMFSYIHVYVFIFAIIISGMFVDSFKGRKFSFNPAAAFIYLSLTANIIGYGALTYKTCDLEINEKMKQIDKIIPPDAELITNAAFWFIAPYRDFREWGYFNRKPELIQGKNFYLLTFEYGKNEDKKLVNKIIKEESRKIDTVMTTTSRIYGRMEVIRIGQSVIK